MKKLLIFLLASWVAFSVKAQNPMYVTQSGAGSFTGADWTNAISGTALQATLASAPANTTILIAGGLYKPTTSTGPASRTISFTIPSGVQVYGGYAGSGSPGTRTEFPSSTTLSAEIGNPSSTTDNSFHVVRFANANSTTRLDGFVLTGGYANGITDFGSRMGGAVENYGNTSDSGPRLINCIFENNYAEVGGAIGNRGNTSSGRKGTLRLNNCLFTNNSAQYSGGAVLNTQGTDIRFINCNFINNAVTSFTVVPNLLVGGNGGAICNAGGGGGPHSSTLINCSFSNNTAPQQGGAIANDGNCSVRLFNCSMSSNTALAGDALYNSSISTFLPVSISMTNSILWDNGTGGENTIVNSLTETGSPFSGTVTITAINCLIDASETDYTSVGPPTLTTDPLFIDASTNNLRLTAGSPAIDAGTTYGSITDLDLAGNTRVIGASIDLGAYEFPGLSVTATASAQTVCVGQPITLSAITADGSPPISYSWVAPVGVILSSTSASVVSGTITLNGPQQITLVVTDANSQTATGIASITASPLPDASFSGLAALYCTNSSSITLHPVTTGGTFSGPGITGTTFNPANAGSGGIISYSVTSANGCSASTSQSVTVSGQLPPITNFVASGALGNGNCSVQLTALATGNSFVFTGPRGYVFSNVYWADGQYRVFANQVVQPGIYTLTAYGSGGCQTSQQITVTGTACP